MSDGWGVSLTPIRLVSMFMHVTREKGQKDLRLFDRQTRNVLGYDRKLTRVGPGMKVLPSFKAP